MRFVHTEEQTDFARTLDRLLTGADTVAAARAWAEGETAPGLALWHTLAEQGVHALLVPEEADGMGASAVELVIAFEALGRHAVPGPYVESAAYLPHVLTGDPLSSLAAGAVATVAAPPQTPYALDADIAEHVFLIDDSGIATAEVGQVKQSIDPTRRLGVLTGRSVLDAPPVDSAAAFDLAALATAAQLLGAGERILADSVTYVKQRKQFGREIGSYQAIKHQLADVQIALAFARPLIDGAAVGATGSPGDRARDVSAAKIAAADAAYLASRVGLQVHGAIGYTAEFDLSLWLLKVRALVTAWGTPAFHRQRVLTNLVGA